VRGFDDKKIYKCHQSDITMTGICGHHMTGVELNRIIFDGCPLCIKNGHERPTFALFNEILKSKIGDPK